MLSDALRALVPRRPDAASGLRTHSAPILLTTGPGRSFEDALWVFPSGHARRRPERQMTRADRRSSALFLFQGRDDPLQQVNQQRFVHLADDLIEPPVVRLGMFRQNLELRPAERR